MKRLSIIILCVVMFAFGACTKPSVNAEQTYPIKIWGQNSNGNYHTLLVVDDETNVNYIVVATELGGGHRSVSITPRYNADGTLYTGG